MFGVSGQNVQQHAEKEQEQKLDLVIALEVNKRDPQTRIKNILKNYVNYQKFPRIEQRTFNPF